MSEHEQTRNLVLKTLRLLHTPGSVIELRIPTKTNLGVISGYYDDFEKCADDIAALDGHVPNIYVTLNPVKSKDAPPNAPKENATNLTADENIVKRRWLPIDFDPVRKAGVSSTDEEHEAALQRANDCTRLLSEQGWPEPVVADSGNGAHLLWAIDLQNDEESRCLVVDCLTALDAKFSDDNFKIDLKTANASRVWKVYGTMACKGENTPERPHRRAKVISTPQSPAAVSPDLLAKLAAMKPQGTTTRNDQTTSTARVEQPWWPRYEERLTRAKTYLAKIPGAISGFDGHGQTWSAALAITRGFALEPDDALKLLWEEYNPRCEPPWSLKELEHKVRDVYRTDRSPWGFKLGQGTGKWKQFVTQWVIGTGEVTRVAGE